MNAMNNIPGFTAEASFYNTKYYQMEQVISALKSEGSIIPQQIGAPLQHMSEKSALAQSRIIVRCRCPCCICIGNICVCC